MSRSGRSGITDAVKVRLCLATATCPIPVSGTASPRRYKKILFEDGLNRREQVLAQASFYAGARSTLKVLAHLLEHGDDEALHRTIQGHGRQIRALQGLRATSAAALKQDTCAG